MSRSLGGTSFTIRSPIFNSPEEISSRPAIIRRLVVFPHPEGPTRTMNSPSLMARFRSLTASTSPYFLVTWSNVTVAMCAPHSTGASRVPASSRHSASWTDPVRGAGSSWPMLTLPAVAPGVARGDRRADRLVPCQTSSGGTFGRVGGCRGQSRDNPRARRWARTWKDSGQPARSRLRRCPGFSDRTSGTKHEATLSSGDVGRRTIEMPGTGGCLQSARGGSRMATAPAIHITRDRFHLAWDPAIPAIETVGSGDLVELDMLDASGGQLTGSSTADDLGRLDFSRVDQVNGPIAVAGAEAGDTLQIDLLEFEPADWGWTASIPGFGLLADDFPDPYLRITRVPAVGGRAEFLPGIRVPVVPFCGEVGVVPPTGPRSTIPPDVFGGNMDTRHLTAGATLFLPVFHDGARLSMGDGHAAQGDGEVCGTAIETPM